MTQEDIELLATDISARVKYDVKVQLIHNEKTMDKYKTYLHPHLLDPIRVIAFINYEVRGCSKYKLNIGGEVICIDDCMPFLRPMSSMTEEEKKELGNFAAAIMFASQNKNHLFQLTREALVGDFFNKHHIDYRGLIEKGLAKIAPEGMYNLK